MTLRDHMRSLDALASRLPFAVDDYDAVNGAFGRWRTARAPRQRETLELWAYCYARRYFLVKYLRDPSLDPEEMDRPIGEAFRRVCAHLDAVEQPERFASYASVICKNTFINAVRREARYHRRFVAAADAPEPVADPHDPLDGYDVALLRHALTAAIARLPESLREVARLRFLEGADYDRLEEATGLPRPNLRSYANKAAQRLREDPLLLDFLRDWEA